MSQPTLFDTSDETEGLRALNAELVALRDRHQTLLNEQRTHDEQVREAAREEARRNALRILAAALDPYDSSRQAEAIREIIAAADAAISDAQAQAAHWFNQAHRDRAEYITSAEGRATLIQAGWTPPPPVPGIRS